MFCPSCGAPNDDNNYRCERCAELIQPGAVKVSSSDAGDNAVLRALLPVGRSGLAIAAGYAGLFSLVIVPAPLALLLGVLAVRDLKRNPKKHGMGRAIFGIAMGVLGTGAMLVMLISILVVRK